MGEDEVSGLMFADDFVEISQTPGRTDKTNREGTVEYTRTSRVTTNEKKMRGSCMTRG